MFTVVVKQCMCPVPDNSSGVPSGRPLGPVAPSSANVNLEAPQQVSHACAERKAKSGSRLQCKDKGQMACPQKKFRREVRNIEDRATLNIGPESREA
ncbi:uncharacterized protein PITG_03080 [Phytophthora infestans T30-4]|uniref:Uncharacterized protein n=1 Tax=Phytophthora infestans (strain T30-4) TaxID=403677 RepID=D0MZB8_PHYIT|nr:uncharacterized protein PITG_03080 [Phytophthora infestans T30-4]EEY65581.1 hypothetical protein PITG_03080 [Phytophthora infestans T30-4]|eukprot:XP_002906180.1 hypothetical protein PITG_03080 [Phytophthora infestans T30-4]